MPKIIELTVEIDIQKVSCPGVWLCQDGRVSLTVFALGTSYQTCLLPPLFPLMFKDVFYFRKRFQETCTLNNICCLLKDETIFCELVQWCENCLHGECVTLAQYLGALNDVLFPPNMCSSDGIDLLMRRTSDFPGILSPKIEVATKVRIDEVWNQKPTCQLKTISCHCTQYGIEKRQRQVCHTPQYHRSKCSCSSKRPRSRSRSESSRSCISFKEPDTHASCKHPNTVYIDPPRLYPERRACSAYHRRRYDVYNVHTGAGGFPDVGSTAADSLRRESEESIEEMSPRDTETIRLPEEERLQKTLLESRFIEEDLNKKLGERAYLPKMVFTPKIKPCICEICKRYHELFHTEKTKS